MERINGRFLLAVIAVVAGLWLGDIPEARGAEGALEPGLIQVHFDQSSFTRPRDWTIEPQINLDTRTEHTDYALIYLGAIRIPTSREITFGAEVDNGCVLTIGGRKVIDGLGTNQRQGKLTAQEGETLPLEVKFYQSGGPAFLRLFWAWEGHARELVPASAFFHSANDRRMADEMVAVKLVPDIPAFPPGERVGHIYEPDGPNSGRLPEGSGPIALTSGPQLFLDDYLVESSRNVTRKPITLQRDPAIPNPVITGAKDNGDRNFQPWLSCLRDPQTGRFRFWYNIGIDSSTSGLGYLESNDGIRWERPHRQLPKPDNINFCVGVIDEGPDFQNAAERFKMAFHAKGSGAEIWASPDGLDWSFFAPGPRPTADIINLARDTARNRYILTHGTPAVPADGYVGRAPKGGIRRMVGQSVSPDLKQWSPPRRIVMPGDKDEGITEFYGVGGLRNRGELIVGMLKVLRDDLPCDPDGPAEGIAYTVVAWTHDGENWLRERLPLLDRDHAPDAWDHAHAWVDVQLPVGDEVFLYYGGYKQGHKINRFEERQVGLVKMKRDRYIAREAGAEPGRLATPLVTLEADRMSVNVEPEPGGEVRVRIVDAAGKPIDGFDFEDCQPIVTDAVAAPVQWKRPLSELKSKPVRLEFSLNLTRLYGFDLE